MKKIVLGISGGISFLIFLILLYAAGHIERSLPEQNAARRWSSEGEASQVSCFFSAGASMSADRLIGFEHTVDSALKDAGITMPEEDSGVRLWVDAYSADGTISVSSDRAKLNNVNAIGFGGDFFLLHPLTLVSGSYFSGNDTDYNYCVIDRDAAWQLFGSNNIAGMTVFIGGYPFIVTGVVERPSGRLAEAAGLSSTVVYVAYDTLKSFGRCNAINHYEIVMPNPVSSFAYDFVKKNLGSDEKATEVIENTTRFSFINRVKSIKTFGTRSMNSRAIVFPYWENIARGYEEILLVVTVFEILFLVYPVMLVLVLFVIWWRHKGWTLKDVYLKVKDKAERLVEKLRAARLDRKDRKQGKSRPEKSRDQEKNRKRDRNRVKDIGTGSEIDETAAVRDRKLDKAIKKAEKRRKKEIRQEIKEAEKERKKNKMK